MIKLLISQGETHSYFIKMDQACDPAVEQTVSGASGVTVKHFVESNDAIAIIQDHLQKAGYYNGPADGQWHDPQDVSSKENFNSAFTRWLREKQFEVGGTDAADGWLGAKTLESLKGKIPDDVQRALTSLLETQVDGQSAYSRLHRRNEYHAQGVMLDGMCIAAEGDIPDAADGVTAYADTVSGHDSVRITGADTDAEAVRKVPEPGFIKAEFTVHADPNTGTKIIPVTVADVQNWREAGLSKLTEDQRKALDKFDGARKQALRDAGYDDAVARRDLAKDSLENGTVYLKEMREALTANRVALSEQLKALRNQPITVTVMGREETHSMASLGDRPFTVFGTPINGSQRDLAIHDAISAKYKELLESSGYNLNKDNMDALAHRVNTADSIGGFWDERRQELKNAELAVENIRNTVDSKPIQVAITFDMTEGTVAGKITDAPSTTAQDKAPENTGTPTSDRDLSLPSGTVMAGTPRMGDIG